MREEPEERPSECTLLAETERVGALAAGAQVYFLAVERALGAVELRTVPATGGEAVVLARDPRLRALAVDGNTVYYVVGDDIHRAGAPEALVRGAPGRPMIEAHDGHVYARDVESGAISRIPEAGGRPEVLLPASSGALQGLTVAGGFVYFRDDEGVRRIPTSGGAAEAVIETPLAGAPVIAGEHIVWSEREPSGEAGGWRWTLHAREIEGGSPRVLATSSGAFESLRATATRVVWVDVASAEVRSVPSDGSAPSQREASFASVREGRTPDPQQLQESLVRLALGGDALYLSVPVPGAGRTRIVRCASEP